MTMREVGAVLITILFLPVYAVIAAYFMVSEMVEKRRAARKQISVP